MAGLGPADEGVPVTAVDRLLEAVVLLIAGGARLDVVPATVEVTVMAMSDIFCRSLLKLKPYSLDYKKNLRQLFGSKAIEIEGGGNGEIGVG